MQTEKIEKFVKRFDKLVHTSGVEGVLVVDTESDTITKNAVSDRILNVMQASLKILDTTCCDFGKVQLSKTTVDVRKSDGYYVAIAFTKGHDVGKTVQRLIRDLIRTREIH